MEEGIGLRTVPCGVPVLVICLYEFPLLTEVYCTLAERKLYIQLLRLAKTKIIILDLCQHSHQTI